MTGNEPPRPSSGKGPTESLVCLVSVCLGVTMSLLAGRAFADQMPWEIWHDLHRIAQLRPGDQVLLRSSHCPSGCRYDRHSEGDWRYIRLDGDEGVIFEEAGAGAITRIWMTMGQGVSQPLEPSVRLRIYLDGASAPVLDMPLPDLFGSTPPFLPPLVGDRLVSSGGNFSYVPIPYRDGCRVTLEGAHEQKIWFQFTFHRRAESAGITSFSGNEDLSAWAALLGAAGEDPWPDSPASTLAGEIVLAPGEKVSLAQLTGPDSLTALRFRLPEPAWPNIELRLDFDGKELVRLGLSDFFAIGLGAAEGSRSLLLGVAEDQELYSYFPMPFFFSAEVSLENLAASGSPVAIGYQVRRANREPSPASGLFAAHRLIDDETQIGFDVPFLNLEGEGKWVGIFAELGSVGTVARSYLEGDERLFIDDSPHPAVYGTGTEDLFNGGFYFDQGSFRLALHGSPYHFVADGEDVTGAYRLMLTDAVSFAHSLRAGLEAGPTNNIQLRARTVAYYYLRPPGLWRWDTLHLGEACSRTAHAYTVTGPYELLALDGLFEGEPPQAHQATGVYRPPGTAQFCLRVDPAASRLRLRRRFDAGHGGQEAEIWLAGVFVGRFPPMDENTFRRWREIDIDLAGGLASRNGELELTIVALTGSAPEAVFTAFTYELWSDVDPAIVADGFEAGDFSSWASASTRALPH